MDQSVEQRLLLRSQIVTFAVIIGELILIVPLSVLAQVWLWLAIVISMALSPVALLARMRMVGPGSRGRAFRRALTWAPVITAALTLPIGLAIGTSKDSAEALFFLAVGSVLLTLPAAAIGYVAIERSLPESLREGDNRRWVWRPSAGEMRKLLLAWPPISLAVFWVITGLATKTDCGWDGSCSSGVPITFARFGMRDLPSSMYWGRFAADLGLFATVLPAGFLCATSRVRGVAAVYLLVVCAVIGLTVAEQWGGLEGLRSWSQLDLLELGR